MLPLRLGIVILIAIAPLLADERQGEHRFIHILRCFDVQDVLFFYISI